jgi:hypothetical protein
MNAQLVIANSNGASLAGAMFVRPRFLVGLGEDAAQSCFVGLRHAFKIHPVNLSNGGAEGNGSAMQHRLRCECAIKGRGVHFEKRGHCLPVVIALVDQLAGVLDLLRVEFSLAPKFHATLFRRLHSGARALADKAPFKLGQDAYHLPHGAACRRIGVDVFRQGMKFDAPLFQVVEHGD